MQQQIPRPQLGTDQYHDLVLFQAFTLMNTQLALARAEADLKTLAEQLVTQTKRAEAAEQALSDTVQKLPDVPTKAATAENYGGSA